MKSKVILEFEPTDEDKLLSKFIIYNKEVRYALFKITHNLSKETNHFIESKTKDPTSEEIIDFVIGFINDATQNIPNDILEF